MGKARVRDEWFDGLVVGSVDAHGTHGFDEEIMGAEPGQLDFGFPFYEAVPWGE